MKDVRKYLLSVDFSPFFYRFVQELPSKCRLSFPTHFFKKSLKMCTKIIFYSSVSKVDFTFGMLNFISLTLFFIKFVFKQRVCVFMDFLLISFVRKNVVLLIFDDFFAHFLLTATRAFIVTITLSRSKSSENSGKRSNFVGFFIRFNLPKAYA